MVLAWAYEWWRWCHSGAVHGSDSGRRHILLLSRATMECPKSANLAMSMPFSLLNIKMLKGLMSPWMMPVQSQRPTRSASYKQSQHTGSMKGVECIENLCAKGDFLLNGELLAFLRIPKMK